MSETFKPGKGPGAEGSRHRDLHASGSRSQLKTGSVRPDGMQADIMLALVVCLVVGWFFFKSGSGGAGGSGSGSRRRKRPPEPYSTLGEVQAAIRKQGVESCNLILGIDFTKSNTWNGSKTFAGRSLHDTSRKGVENPYQRVMRILSQTLEAFDEDNIIPCYGFGDVYTGGKECFSFFPDRGCAGLPEVLERYNEIVSKIQMSGPTNFAPVIRKAIEIVKETGQFHVLVIIADGQVDKRAETVQAIVDASKVALSIVCVGIGDGPWETMEEFDDAIPQRDFDNFQFVPFHEIEKDTSMPVEPHFACMALMELPAQYAAMRRLNLL
mmetsp:Transcript_19328/g.37603  ORF Transcript_19328/g.37603 Transcript_19328/m.37603 type:complete len:325 (+) Transcript_19328:710-1684(+)|eukprot:CAMPEP_0173380366 /NCGR_PEP_ID=MMETSP1356-20130122/3065_1 /TAXON_ID=77927 ORGANISM="Hemiselmis virescens, Strain PCC157" /NCGR_SAMPLE_ID=MMETSP1356 /ASSEMBLY_ACC=CAM_ASM_000847 /LENGTH=324 /DNA_ID=CAMNT_0014333931 /DNA_START=243 /DNA_END=1217 /DNA_ORIENTATION=-